MTRRPPWMGDTIPVNAYLEALCAAHLSSYVKGPFRERGGVMVVGPPGVLKSTALGLLDSNYPDALSLSDVNAQMLHRLKERIQGGGVRTLVLPEFSKLYERNQDTASNVEGTIRALASEGFSSASFEDPSIGRLRAHATVIAAMTGEFRDRHAQRWDSSGFARRFLWSLVKLSNADLLDQAVEDWALVELRVDHVPMVPAPPAIPNLTTTTERKQLRLMVKYQPYPHSAQFQLLVKMLAVLKWWQRARRRSEAAALHTISLFARSLGKHGAEIVL